MHITKHTRRLLSTTLPVRAVLSAKPKAAFAQKPLSSKFHTSTLLLKKREEGEHAKTELASLITEDQKDLTKTLKPKEIVDELNRHIVGQNDAKKAVAIAMRNRWRRQMLNSSLKNEIIPKNILMIGPTGVGKTEIARRMAKLCDSPFIKVEATKFTEVGFHGRDVDTIIRDLVDVAIAQTKTNMKQKMKDKAAKVVEERLLDQLVGTAEGPNRENFRELLRNGDLENREIEIDVPDTGRKPKLVLPGNNYDNMSNMNDFLGSMFEGMMPQKSKRQKLKVSQCRQILEEKELEKMLNMDLVTKEALRSVEQESIVFIDEIDKICSHNKDDSRDASAEGVQRDLLPLIEGTTINTKYGNVQTDHILFITSGAFHSVKPSDMLAELQGRLPIRVELKGLTEEDMYRILVEPENNLLRQNIELLKTEGVTLNFSEKGTKEIAKVATELNTSVENIGARRLITVIEKLLEDISFNAPDLKGQTVTITEDDVQKHLRDLMKKSDFSKFVL